MEVIARLLNGAFIEHIRGWRAVWEANGQVKARTRLLATFGTAALCATAENAEKQPRQTPVCRLCLALHSC